MLESILIASVVFILYVRTMRFGVIVDDIKHYKDIQNGLLDQPWYKSLIFRLYGGGTFVRYHDCKCKETPCKVCAGRKRIARLNGSLDHLFTTCLFALTCVLIYWAFGADQISLLAALLYACNPANNQTSIWLNGRRYSINIIFTLLMMLFGVLFYLPTPFLQVNAIFAPILLGWWGVFVIALALAVGWSRMKKFYDKRMSSIVNEDMRRYDLNRVVVIVKTFGFYLQKMVFPGRTQMVYEFISQWGLTEQGNKEAYRIDKHFWLGIVGMVLVAAGLVFIDQKTYILFLALSTLQFCNIITPTQTAADRYVSMPNVFMMYFVSYFAVTYGGVYALPILALLAGYYIANLSVTMRMYQSIYSFYEYHNYFEPANVILRKFRVNWLLKTNDVLSAWELIKIGLLHRPNDFTMLYQAGVCMHMMGEAKSSEEYFARAEKNHYINQESLWQPSMAAIRAKNQQILNKRVAIQPADWKGR